MVPFSNRIVGEFYFTIYTAGFALMMVLDVLLG